MTVFDPRSGVAVALVLALAACNDTASNAPSEAPSPTAESADTDAASPPPRAKGEAIPSGTPIRVERPEDAVRAYYEAIDAGDFAAAYGLWRDGASGQSYSQFRQGFAATRSTKVTIAGPIETGGAAGSIYATVPVEVQAVLKDGTRQRFTGEYVLRRANDVPGATEEQRAWHIESASLRPA